MKLAATKMQVTQHRRRWPMLNSTLAIAEASHNVVLIQMMRSLFDLLQYNVLLGRKKVYNDPVNGDLLSEQHFQVMDAIDRKDPEAARQAVRSY